MKKAMFGMLVAGLVVGCAIEEPESSGMLSVDSSSDVEVPEGLTAASLDLNKDGIINIQDLVIMSKFFGQEVAEDSAGIGNDGEEFPKLPEFVYIVINLGQVGWYNGSEYIVEPDYGRNLLMAIRIQVKERNRSEVLKELKERWGNRRIPSPVDLIVYMFPEVKVKIISDQKKPTKKNYTFNKYNKKETRHLWGGGKCKFTSSTYTQSQHGINSLILPSFFFEIRYIEAKDLSDKKCNNDFMEIFHKSLHIGEKLSNNLEDEEYTNIFIRWFTFKIEPEPLDRERIKTKITYHFTRYDDKETRVKPYGQLVHQFLTPSIQQQIKEEHFPEDL